MIYFNKRNLCTSSVWTVRLNKEHKTKPQSKSLWICVWFINYNKSKLKRLIIKNAWIISLFIIYMVIILYQYLKHVKQKTILFYILSWKLIVWQIFFNILPKSFAVIEFHQMAKFMNQNIVNYHWRKHHNTII